MIVYVGGKNFLYILWETVYGVAYLPLEGCRSNHIVGFVRGSYSAFVSFFIKPVIGLYDFLISIFDVRREGEYYMDFMTLYTP